MTRKNLSEKISQVSVTPHHPVSHSGAQGNDDFAAVLFTLFVEPRLPRSDRVIAKFPAESSFPRPAATPPAVDDEFLHHEEIERGESPTEGKPPSPRRPCTPSPPCSETPFEVGWLSRSGRDAVTDLAHTGAPYRATEWTTVAYNRLTLARGPRRFGIRRPNDALATWIFRAKKSEVLPESETRVEGDSQILERPPQPDHETPKRLCQAVEKPIPRTMESAGFRFRQRHPESDAPDDLHRRTKSRFRTIPDFHPTTTGREEQGVVRVTDE